MSKSSGGTLRRSSSTVATTSRVDSLGELPYRTSPIPRCPPAGRLALGVDHPVVGLRSTWRTYLPVGRARRGTVDAAWSAVHPLPDQDAGEPDLAPAAEAHADDDLVEALAEAFLDVDVAAEGRGDRRGQVSAGELLGPLIELEVSVGDIDRLVRHGYIVTFILCCVDTYEYTYIVWPVKSCCNRPAIRGVVGCDGTDDDCEPGPLRDSPRAVWNPLDLGRDHVYVSCPARGSIAGPAFEDGIDVPPFVRRAIAGHGDGHGRRRPTTCATSRSTTATPTTSSIRLRGHSRHPGRARQGAMARWPGPWAADPRRCPRRRRSAGPQPHPDRRPVSPRRRGERGAPRVLRSGRSRDEAADARVEGAPGYGQQVMFGSTSAR